MCFIYFYKSVYDKKWYGWNISIRFEKYYITCITLSIILWSHWCTISKNWEERLPNITLNLRINNGFKEQTLIFPLLILPLKLIYDICFRIMMCHPKILGKSITGSLAFIIQGRSVEFFAWIVTNNIHLLYIQHAWFLWFLW